MSMTDEELDRDWKPNGRRPQSCVKFPFPFGRFTKLKPVELRVDHGRHGAVGCTMV